MIRNILITLLLFLTFLIISFEISEIIGNDSILEQKQIVTNLAANTTYTIQVQLSTSLSATSALAALIRQNGKIKDFDKIAEEMLNIYNGISSLQLAPNGVVTEIYPIKGNENAKGNLLDDPKRKTEAFEAIKSGKLTLAGPYELKQGGIGVIGRYPVFLNNQENKKFWGFTIVLIKLNELLSKSTIPNLDYSNYYYKLWRIHPDSGKSYIFATNNNENVWNSPVNFDFFVPNGKWTLSIEPKNSWRGKYFKEIAIIISFLISTLLSIFIFLLLKNHSDMKQNALNLAEMNATKDKFFSIIAHDLRSPFNGFLALTQMMSENINDFTIQELQKISKTMQSSANNLYKLLENLLEWSRVQRKLIKYSPEICDLFSIVKQIIDIQTEVAYQKEIELVNLFPENINIFADKQMLCFILRNLISNGIKFTKQGGRIEIGVIRNYVKSFLIFYVKDNGIGMDNQIKNNLFRIDKSVTNEGTAGEIGTGLGLILCKEFIEKHNGKIWVESEEGKGSIFYFTLFKSE